VRFFWVLRTYALRAGELTGLGDDVFFLDAEQIAAALDGAAVDRAAMAADRRAYDCYRGLPGYPPLIIGHFDPYAWAADPRRRTDLFAEGLAIDASTVIRGFPGSAGRVEGTVRLIHDAADGASYGRARSWSPPSRTSAGRRSSRAPLPWSPTSARRCRTPRSWREN
jgi:rifampicin phosphotransferase